MQKQKQQQQKKKTKKKQKKLYDDGTYTNWTTPANIRLCHF